MAKGAYINDLDQIQLHLIYDKLKQMQKRVSAADVQAEAKLFITGRQYSRSTVHSIITTQTREDAQFTLSDRIWSVGAENGYNNPLPPTILLIILKIQHDIADGSLTVREAEWVARLSSIYYFNPLADNPDYVKQKAKDLWAVATLYALFAKTCDSLRVSCDTSPLDDPDPNKLKVKVLVWFKGKVRDELYQKLLTITGNLPIEHR